MTVGRIDLLVETAKELGRTPSQVALSWLFSDRRVTAAIIGARRVDQVAENLAAGDFDLPEEVYRKLTDAMPLALGYPYSWMSGAIAGALGGKAEFEPNHAGRFPGRLA